LPYGKEKHFVNEMRKRMKCTALLLDAVHYYKQKFVQISFHATSVAFHDRGHFMRRGAFH